MAIDYKFFEKVICYKAITDATYLNTISDYVKPDYFEDANIAKYFSIVKDFYEKRQKLPTLTEVKTYLTTDILRNGFKRLVESFKELDRKIDNDELYQNTESFLKERAAWTKILEIAENVEHKTKNPSEVLADFEDIVAITLQTDKGFELYSDVDRLVNSILNEEETLPSKWPWLDDAIGGGFRKNGKALYMFAGQANIGKSIFLGNVAANIAEMGKTVLVVSLEMSEELYAQRIASNVTKIPMRDFKNDAHSLRASLKDSKEKTNGKIFIKEFPPATITVKQLTAFVKKLEDSGEKIDAIIIDYVGLLHSTTGSNSYERIKNVCEQVRAMSYIFKCPVISACQNSRSGYDVSNPGMDVIAESIGIAATADVILSIFQNEEDLELKIIRLGMMKNRFGPRGMVQAMKIDYSTLTIVQSSEEEEIMDGDEISLLERFAN
jgi:replicative DNA helicase